MAPQEDSRNPGTPVGTISLVINNKTYTVGPNIPPWTRLVDFLREVVILPGTKVLCREGGCGACAVVATVPDKENEGQTKTFSVHACQTLVYSCAGWNIETVENLGNRYEGYHPIQQALHGFYGTQCGYCTPGMVMTMYGQTQGSGPLTSEKVEKSLDGNICRCTGYRPILDAFKSLTVNADQKLKDKLLDIEEAYKGKCKKSGDCGDCTGKCGGKEGDHGTAPSVSPGEIQITSGSVRWYRPTALAGIYDILKSIDQEKFRIVVGNTGQGVFKNDGPYSVFIASDGIEELYSTRISSPLELGANVSLARAIEVFQHMAEADPGYRYLRSLVDHWQVVANVSVRNIGSWAGNLMMKHAHKGFQSDIFLTLLVSDAELVIGHAADSTVTRMNLEQFLEADMSKSVILKVVLPPASPNTMLQTFKITPRAVNAHAYVNACFKFEVDDTDGFKVTRKPTILFGGINPDFIHATLTENFMLNKKLSDPAVVVEAARILGSEVEPDNLPQDASPAYRKALSQCLLYKTVVGFLGDQVSAELRSAGPNLERPLSSGQQQYDMDKEIWPVGEPIPKLESATQISGEAAYLDDMPYLPNELHGSFVQTTLANAKIASVDPTEALKVSGVVTFVTAADIPGRNSFVLNFVMHPDPIFAEEQSHYAGQPVGLVVAKDRDTAVRAAKLVKIAYENIKEPVLTIKDALRVGGREEIAFNVISLQRTSSSLGDPEGQMKVAPRKLVGEFTQGPQYHFNMEPLSARVLPTEDGYDVFSTTQWATEAQATAAQVLGVTVNSINVTVRRLGGAYGAKVTRAHLVSTAAAVAARKVQQPVRVVLDLNTNMTCAGWRDSYLCKYEVGFDDEGKLLALKVDLYSDAGYVSNESPVGFLISDIQNCYLIPNLLFTPHVVNTDICASTYCRTPGRVNAIATIESILNHVASYLKKDPLEVRLANMAPPNVPRLMSAPLESNVVKDSIIPLLMEKSAYTQRKAEVEQFNRRNTWKKKGLSLQPLYYAFDYPPMFRFGVQVSIYEHDGTVAISHGGIEMGQGINTKVAQVVAYILGVPIAKIVVKPTDTMIGANSSMTAGSFGSDICAHGLRVASTALKKRMDAVRENIKKETDKDPEWLELVKKCHAQDIDLCERHWTPGNEHPAGYNIWAACCTEVEVDILTGAYMISRVDLVEDSGRSMNPYVDIGQVEGALIMGFGLYTTEEVKFDPATGQRLSDGTWEYKPPTALDIPADLRITLLPNAKNPYGVLGSKATGEPPICLAYSVVSALREAITSFRVENGDDSWFQMDTPLTAEAVHNLCGINIERFKLSAADK